MLNLESRKILVMGSCIFRRGVASIVRDVVPGASIAEAFCLADARARLNRGEFLAAILDVDGDEFNGPVGLRALRLDYPRLILVVVSRTASAGDILGYMAAGVTGYILERSAEMELERAVRKVLDGAIYIPPDAIEPPACEPELVLPELRRNGCRLTPRQNGVLRLLLQGYSNKEIARQLDLSPHTVKIHVSALLRCFAVQKRSSLAAVAALDTDETVHCGPFGAPRLLQISA